MNAIVRIVQVSLCLLGGACHLGRTDRPSSPVPQTTFEYDADSVCTDSSPRWLPTTRASDTLTAPAGVASSPRGWAYWARHIPGGWAGGPYYPWPGMGATATIYLRDTTAKDLALAALDTLVPPRSRRPSFATPIAARQARWDLAELYDWQAFIVANFARANGVSISAWGLGREGLTIAIVDRSMLGATIDWLHELNVPCHLVTVEIRGRWVTTAGAVATPNR